MAECAASASCIKLHLRRAGGTAERGPSIRKLKFGKECHHNFNFVPLRARRIHQLGISSPKFNTNLRRQATSFSCTCLGSLTSLDGTVASEWVLVVDQVLLMASMLLTYMGGVTPIQKPSYSSASVISGDATVSESSTFSGRASKVNEEDSNWDIIKGKLLNSLDATRPASNVGDEDIGFEQFCKRPLNLNALAEGPRLRLLLAIVMHLEKEVRNIQGDYETASTNDWRSMILSQIIQKSIQPISIGWISKELLKDDNNSNVELPSLIVEKFTGDDTVLPDIRKSGKEDLYVDLLCFLRFGFVRDGSYYENHLFVSEGTSILEDLVIGLADGIASVYLELISVDGTLSNEMNNLSLNLCSLSTRSLQKLRNEVALNQWLHQNMEAVVSMYEDRFDLSILQSHFIAEPSSRTAENMGWWKKLMVKKSATAAFPLQYVVIGNLSMPVKRTRELRALTGWRYYFSLFLELSDITMPLIRKIINKVSDAISFFLVCLIGRSLGLIYTGIRQSLRWK